jgi:SAM-dependent methyltransferase
MEKIQNLIKHPDSTSELISFDENYYYFSDGSFLPIINGIPVLFGRNSIFSASDILTSKKTTQNKQHLDTSNIKNYIRRKMLPSLCKDFNISDRYHKLSSLLPNGSIILILGTGEKNKFYKEYFSSCKVITSDVHGLFDVDYIFDGHNIPFKDNIFDLVLAAQVIEHVINPWQFSKEIQRVTKIGGLVQIEAPQNFPYHAEPYDFFRFTFTGLRSLFSNCSVLDVVITEGNASMVAVSISNLIINSTDIKILRRIFLFFSTLFLGWMKYLDLFSQSVNRRSISMPKGYAFTFKKDEVYRKNLDLLSEFYKLKK